MHHFSFTGVNRGTTGAFRPGIFWASALPPPSKKRKKKGSAEGKDLEMEKEMENRQKYVDKKDPCLNS